MYARPGLYKLRIWTESVLAAQLPSNKDKHTFPSSTFVSLGNRTMGNSPYLIKLFYEFLLFTIPTIFTKAVNCYINFGANSDIFAWIKLRKVIFIHKNNKKTNFPKDYRPISLLGVFYKIIAKTGINRLDSIGDEIFDPNQFGFVRKRSASCATKSIQIIQDHCKDGCAFDRLGLKPLLAILKCMDIPDIYIKWIKNLIENGNALHS